MSPRLSYDEIAKQNVAKLLDYAVKHLYLEDYDVIYVQNQLLDALKLTEPTDSDKIGDYDFYEVMDSLSSYAVRKKIIDENQKLLFETRLIGYCMPTPSKVVDMFDDIASYDGPKAACDMLHTLGIDSAYLRKKTSIKTLSGNTTAKEARLSLQSTSPNPKKHPNKYALPKRQRPVIPSALCVRKISDLRATPLWLLVKPYAPSHSNSTERIGLCSSRRTVTLINTSSRCAKNIDLCA